MVRMNLLPQGATHASHGLVREGKPRIDGEQANACAEGDLA